MKDHPVNLDERRGMAAQKATTIRRMIAEVEADAAALRQRQEELESQLSAGPATSWHDASEKARYLLNLFAMTDAAEDPRRRKLLASVLDDFERLSRDDEGPGQVII